MYEIVNLVWLNCLQVDMQNVVRSIDSVPRKNISWNESKNLKSWKVFNSCALWSWRKHFLFPLFSARNINRLASLWKDALVGGLTLEVQWQNDTENAYFSMCVEQKQPFECTVTRYIQGNVRYLEWIETLLRFAKLFLGDRFFAPIVRRWKARSRPSPRYRMVLRRPCIARTVRTVEERCLSW